MRTNILYYRRLDGTSNNKDQVFWGAALEDVTREAPAMYADGIALPAGADRPSPREISNELFQQVGNWEKRLQNTRTASLVLIQLNFFKRFPLGCGQSDHFAYQNVDVDYL